ncbi:MAG: SLC26A/SulP transporter family protein [Trueperaceae bacterium]|nr:SLC26A/SulP transporter family protein [Trueperaceae bacterium]
MLSTGVIVGLLSVVMAISMASLVYAGALHEFLPNGIGLALASTVLVATTVAILGSVSGTVAATQLAPGAIVAVMALEAVAALPSDAQPIARFMTVATLVATTTLVAGAVFLLVGALRLGSLVRYMPYPVIGGFVAGTGWLLLTGGVRIMSDVSPGLSYATDLFAPGVAVRWLPGLALAVAIHVATRRWRHPLTLAAMVAAATVAFYVSMPLLGGSLDSWGSLGLLLGPFPDSDLLRPLRASDLQYVDWGIVGGGAVMGGTVVLVALIAVLMNTTAIELATGRRADLDREMRSAGLGNLLAGSLGGPIGYAAISLTLLTHRLGSARRVTLLVSVGVVGMVMVFGATLLSFVPTVIVGGVVCSLGLSFLVDWLHGSYARLSRVEYGVVLVILVTVVTVGFLPGIGVGLMLAIALFVIDFGRVDAVRHTLTGSTSRSRVRWSSSDEALLRQASDHVMVLQLQGYLFFGSANGLVERVERHLESGAPLDHVILDFARVTGMDATASASFGTLTAIADSAGFGLVLVGTTPAIARRLDRAVTTAAQGGAPLRLQALDDALEWSERRRLEQARSLEQAHGVGAAPPPPAAPAAFADDAEIRALFPHLERLELGAGRTCIIQGDASDDLFFLATGRLTARLHAPDRPSVRLETMHAGTLVGEIAFYTGSVRGATVVADEASVVYRLRRSELAAITSRDPFVAAAMHRLLAGHLAARLTHLQRIVAALET